VQRLNPNTGKPFERGEYREDGWVFYGYEKQKLKRNGFFPERWADPINFTLEKAFQSSRRRAKEKNLPFNLDVQYLRSIYTENCPVFNVPMTWGNLGVGKNIYSPSLDRIIPALGYVKGNVVFISDKANRIKAEFESKDLYAVADWQHKITKGVEKNVKALAAASISAGDHISGAVGAELGSISTPWTWQDDDHLDDNSRAIHWEDADYRAKTRGGDGVGYGGKEVGTPQAPQSEQDNGVAYGKIVSYEELCRHIFGKP
jgi:hypothetical protein